MAREMTSKYRRKLKDKKVTIYQEVYEPSLPYVDKMAYRPIHQGTLWAYVRQLSAGEFYAAKAVQQTEEIIFTVNYRPDINQECAVLYRGKFYELTRVDTFEGYKDNLHLYGTIMLSQPDEERILPYQEGEE